MSLTILVVGPERCVCRTGDVTADDELDGEDGYLLGSSAVWIRDADLQSGVLGFGLKV